MSNKHWLCRASIFAFALLFASTMCDFPEAAEKSDALLSQLSGQWKLIETIAAAKPGEDDMRDFLVYEQAVEHVAFGPKRISFFRGKSKRFSFADPLRFDKKLEENTWKFVRGGGERIEASRENGDLPPLVAESSLYVRLVDKDMLLLFFGEDFRRDPPDVRLMNPGGVVWILRRGT